MKKLMTFLKDFSIVENKCYFLHRNLGFQVTYVLSTIPYSPEAFWVNMRLTFIMSGSIWHPENLPVNTNNSSYAMKFCFSQDCPMCVYTQTHNTQIYVKIALYLCVKLYHISILYVKIIILIYILKFNNYNL